MLEDAPAQFFTKLVRLGYASMYDCRHNRARIYHVNQRALYAAIDEADSRLRKPVTLNHAMQRLMVLDTIVEDPDLVWLGTAEEKASHLTTLARIEPANLPHVVVGEADSRTVRCFSDRLPTGIHSAGRGVVVYVVIDPWLDEFRVFLERHAALLRALPAWTLRIVAPPQFPDIAQRAKQVVWNRHRSRPKLSTSCVGISNRLGPTPRRLVATTSRSGSTERGTRFQHLASGLCTACGTRTVRSFSPRPDPPQSAKRWRPAPDGSRLLNWATVTAISLPWLPSLDAPIL